LVEPMHEKTGSAVADPVWHFRRPGLSGGGPPECTAGGQGAGLA